jgi:hypothetical protein
VTPRIVALVVVGAAAAAQAPPLPEIEVSSVKANKTVNNAMGNKFGPLTM